MRTIWKFPLLDPETSVLMPRGSKVLAVQLQDGVPTVWAEVETEMPLDQLHHFAAYATGERLPTPSPTAKAAIYRATLQTKNGLVWHIYEMRGVQ